MVPRKILIIDDERAQAQALAQAVQESIEHSSVYYASTQEEILKSIEEKFYNLAIIDIRMDDYDVDGIAIAEKIIEINPFAKILFVSRFIPEYMSTLNKLMQKGNILGFSDKKADYNNWMKELKGIIDDYYKYLDSNPQQISLALIDLYSSVKDEENTYRKGQLFENFVTLLLQYIGFNNIQNRVKDKSLNEVDLIVRNDLHDSFISKLGSYILIECKNKPSTPIDKNDFIIFYSKLEATNGLAKIGFIFSTSKFTRNTYLEAIRTSKQDLKIFLIDNPIIMDLLKAENPLECFKEIIDYQVKDN